VSRSLRRTLAIRFAATMGVGLLMVAAATYFGTHLVWQHGVDASLVQSRMILALSGVVLFGTGATFLGAWWLAGSAVRPVHEITEQATRIAPGTLDQRIAAHADTAEYRGLVAVLNGMLERLDHAFRSQRRLTADVSHELRSPLTALRGEMEVALRADRSARDYQRVLHSALEEIDRLTEMSEDLLLITRADAHVLQARRVPADLNAVVQSALHALRPRIEERELVVEPRFAAEASRAVVDPQLIGRLVQQLLDNAVKFTPVGGRVCVATEALNGSGGVRLVVEDSGLGIAPEHLPHIFEPFFRADQARTRGTGTGLGLAMATAIARLHGGTIRASNVTTGVTGARFEVDLPSVPPEP
jgi:heavy metal sensor kinase